MPRPLPQVKVDEAFAFLRQRLRNNIAGLACLEALRSELESLRYDLLAEASQAEQNLFSAHEERCMWQRS